MARLAWSGSFFRIELYAWVWFPRFFLVCHISSPNLATKRRRGRRPKRVARAHVSCDGKARGAWRREGGATTRTGTCVEAPSHLHVQKRVHPFGRVQVKTALTHSFVRSFVRLCEGSYVGGGHWWHDCTLGLVHTTSTTQAKDGTVPIQAQKCERCNERLMEGDIGQSHASCGDVPSPWNATGLEDGGVPCVVQDRTKGQAVDQCTQCQEVNLERTCSITGTTARSPTTKESWWLSCGPW